MDHLCHPVFFLGLPSSLITPHIPAYTPCFSSLPFRSLLFPYSSFFWVSNPLGSSNWNILKTTNPLSIKSKLKSLKVIAKLSWSIFSLKLNGFTYYPVRLMRWSKLHSTLYSHKRIMYHPHYIHPTMTSSTPLTSIRSKTLQSIIHPPMDNNKYSSCASLYAAIRLLFFFQFARILFYLLILNYRKIISVYTFHYIRQWYSST